MLRRLQDWLALTKTERNVILFVSGAFVAGLAIQFYQETFPPQPEIDYSQSDSTFAALSDAAAGEEPAQSNIGAGGRLDLNTATKEQLVALPGIGEVIAERILIHRQEAGPFRSVEDLRKVRGITTKKLEQLKPLVSITGTHP
ncbi:MAG: helix-hairpin-helix domain-containing protein [Ignavibacteriales bacterium]|nr:helix-hairpin-helix domain-containing protein [Ignavibacteriales bacterium]